ncbi:MAG: amidohydrolase family protein [Agriterribacter sp.]
MKKVVAIIWYLQVLILCTMAQQKPVLLQHVRVIDGNGGYPKEETNVLIEGDRFSTIGANIQAKDATVINMKGKTIMPVLISAHTHIGNLKGTQTNPINYTRENITRHLEHYQRYGIGAVLCMGTDRPLIFDGFRDSSVAAQLPGARMYSAGFGFGMPGSPPGAAFGFDKPFTSADDPEIEKQITTLAALQPAVVKIWVDDFGGSVKKMPEDVYKAIIRAAHKHGIRVAAHLYYLEDAHKLIDAGIDIIAHSIRDKEVDESLLKKMKDKHIVYIPTLARDEFEWVYADEPGWLKDDFFKNSLEPGVYEMITSKEYKDKMKNAPAYERARQGLKIAFINLKKIHDAGIIVAMGTDSGATPARAEGFAEHLEMELMVQAGLTPLQAITVSTKNPAILLQCNTLYGSIEKGKKADFIVLSKNPQSNILNTRSIEAVWKNGKPVQ